MKQSTHSTIAYLFLFTSISTVLYWLFVSFGLFDGHGLLNWLNRFPYVSPIADAWMGTACLLFYLYWRKKSALYIVWGLAASSAMIYVSLTAFTFRVCHFADPFDIPELIEVLIPSYLLLFGAISFRSFIQVYSID